jgi:S-DNA-T family DNA segregation ATPase FtsK/SpoIIIE
VVTGLIKSNMPCRIAFKVASGMDSRIVLDQKGGELLLGQGDMLHLSPSSHKLSRAQGTLVDDKEIRKVVRFLKDIAAPSFERSLMQVKGDMDEDEERIYLSENNSSASLKAAQEDPMFDRAVEIVLETKRGSVSLLQRRLAIGYTRASRLIDLMGIAGILSDHKGSVARDVKISIEEWEAMKDLVAHDQMRLQQQGSGELEDPHQELMFDADGQEIEEEPPFETDESQPAVEVHGTIEDDDEEVEDEYELDDADEDDEDEDEEELEDEENEENEDDEEEVEEDEDEEVADELEEEDEEEVEYEYVDEDGNPIDPADLEDDEYEVEDSDEEEEEDDEDAEYEDEYEEEELEEDEHPTTNSAV